MVASCTEEVLSFGETGEKYKDTCCKEQRSFEPRSYLLLPVTSVHAVNLGAC